MSEVGERLRKANPVTQASDTPVPDEVLLERLLSMSRESQPPAKHRARRLLIALAIGLIAFGGIAAVVTSFAPRYFGSDDAEPTPAAINSSFREIAKDFGQIDSVTVVRLASFDAEGGRATLYGALTAGGQRYCLALAIRLTITGAGCYEAGEAIPSTASRGSNTGDVTYLAGLLRPPAARIEIRFEDGRVRTAALRNNWWTYLVGDDEAEPGHRPVALLALDESGRTVASKDLGDPGIFTSRKAFEASLPKSDGSPGQEAIRALFKHGPGTFEGRVTEQLRLDETRLVRRIETDAGPVDIYRAPWGETGFCFAVVRDGYYFGVATAGCPSGVPDPAQGHDFKDIYVDRESPSLIGISGMPPRSAKQVVVRFEDGTSQKDDIFAPSFFLAWIEGDHRAPGQRPEALIALDDRGAPIETLSLRSYGLG